jgi:hypothetical protein
MASTPQGIRGGPTALNQETATPTLIMSMIMIMVMLIMARTIMIMMIVNDNDDNYHVDSNADVVHDHQYDK